MRVLKFGGSSVASPDRIREITRIVLNANKEEPVIVVVSAFQGISNQLFHCATLAAKGDANYEAVYQQIAKQHHDAIQELLPNDNEAITLTTKQLLHELNEILQGILLIRELTLGATDHIASFGERLSANIIAAYVNTKISSTFVDARQLIFTDNSHTHANVIFDKTNAGIQQCYEKIKSKPACIPIITGFIASNLEGKTTTLGRNSSDYTATIIGAALNASRIEIWTDVDGIYSADPALVDTAFIVPQLSLDEAIELSYFGAKVLHPSTFVPLHKKQIPILIKNTLNPAAPGTLISNENNKKFIGNLFAKSITSIDDITLLIVKGRGEIDVSTIIERLFKSLTSANINIFLVLEGSPKHTICLAISNHEIENARVAIQQQFYLELKHKILEIEEKSKQSIIAIIGDKMKMLSPDIAGKMFQALGKMQININAIIQGASERNISLVIDSHQRTHALNLIHQSFFSKFKNLSLILIGAGRVGSGLLTQIQHQQQTLLDKNINLSVTGITNSKKMLLNTNGIDLTNWKSELDHSTNALDLQTILNTLSTIEYNNIAVIDCTASETIVDKYPMFIEKGIHIITPNKRANILPTKKWSKLMTDFKNHHCHFLYRANVGAGLPILTILDDLLSCGDTIIKIEGIISGTLSYLFNHYDGSLPFSDVLKQAQLLAMTEPDPREDLSGIDVARKLLILARQMGWAMELSDITVQNLVPPTLQQGQFTEQFFEDFKQHEDYFKQRLIKCKATNKVLRYIGTLENQRATAKLQEIPANHPLALSVHSDNIISFTTAHYHETPLVIRGPGAGVECTALGVFSDILKLLNHLPN